MALVSVVVPVYNAELYLDSCIKSIYEQSFQDIEIVIVDDGSADGSFDIMCSWEKKDPRIKIVRQENCGVSVARKKGVEISQGEWISFVDADDVLPYNALEYLIKNRNESDLVIGQVGYIGPGKWRFVTQDESLTPVQYIKKMYQDTIHSVPFARLIKKSILLDSFVFDIPREITHGEDTIMNYRIATKCRQIQSISDIVYKYFVREGSASRQNKFRSLSYCRLYEKNEWASFPKDMKWKLFPIYCKSVLRRRKRWLRMNVKLCLKNLGVVR